MLAQLRRVPGMVDAHIAQSFDYPKFHIDVDRTKAMLGGYTQRDVAGSMLVSLSGSFQTAPTFFLDRQNGVQYSLVTQTPQYQIQSLPDLQNIALSGPGMIRPEILANVGSISRTTEMEVVSHYNVRRAQLIPIQIGRDYGSRVEVLSGLAPTDDVILDPVDSLISGTPVKVSGLPTVTGRPTVAPGK
jgi:multidrug efflux pump subunit AcrB